MRSRRCPICLLARMGSYRTDDAAGLALLLGLLCLALVFIADRFGREKAALEPASHTAARPSASTMSLQLWRGRHALRRRRSGRRPSPPSWGRAARANRRCSIWSPASRRLRSGRVLIGGQDVTALPPAGRPVSMMFQENNLFAHLDVGKNVGLGRSPSLAAYRRRHGGCRRSAGAHRPCRQGAAPAARTVRRRAPARGARARAGPQPPGAAARRAVRLAWAGVARRHARAAGRRAGRAAHDGAVRDPPAGGCAGGSPTTWSSSRTASSPRAVRPKPFSARMARRHSGAISAATAITEFARKRT